MFVGNLATLRPLFRRMLNLGGSDNASSRVITTSNMPQGFQSSSRRTYKNFDTNYELGTLNGDIDDKETNPTSTQIYAGDMKGSPSSITSKSESQKDILEKPNDPKGIVVSRFINISHS
jgi:hypothetical protein